MLFSFDSVPEWLNISPWTLLALSYTVYLAVLGVYRVYFSPLSKFPGPKLAGLTTMYPAYYDICLRGKWFEKLEKLHDQYGPIVRVNPHEIHINDHEFSDVLLTSNSQRRDKYKWFGRQIQLPESVAGTIDHGIHRRRRAALNPYFSKSKVRRLEGRIQGTVKILLERIQKVGKIGGVMHLNIVFKAVACDIITEYCFGTSYGYTGREDFSKPLFDALDAIFSLSWLSTYISWFGPLMSIIPHSVMKRIYPGLATMSEMQIGWKNQIDMIKKSGSFEGEDANIFHGILQSGLPAEEEATPRLQQEAQVMIGAGLDATANVLAGITFELLSHPDMLQKVRTELISALPDVDSMPELAIIEQLPYLSAVITEGLRIHPGLVPRMTRVAPDDTMVYHDKKSDKKWIIPPNTPTQMTVLQINMSPDLFPDPYKFDPERFMENPQLERHMLTFGRGTRICLGFYLAYAEIYITLASIFRKYDLYDGTGKQEGPTLELYDTIRSRDVDINRDFLVMYPADDSKGLRVLVRE